MSVLWVITFALGRLFGIGFFEKTEFRGVLIRKGVLTEKKVLYRIIMVLDQICKTHHCPGTVTMETPSTECNDIPMAEEKEWSRYPLGFFNDFNNFINT